MQRKEFAGNEQRADESRDEKPWKYYLTLFYREFQSKIVLVLESKIIKLVKYWMRLI